MVHALVAFGLGGEAIWIVIGIGVILFGADRLPKLARSAGQAKKEFMMGQAEADEAAARVREQARLREQAAQTDPMDNVTETSFNGQDVPPPTPGKGTLSS